MYNHWVCKPILFQLYLKWIALRFERRRGVGKSQVIFTSLQLILNTDTISFIWGLLLTCQLSNIVFSKYSWWHSIIPFIWLATCARVKGNLSDNVTNRLKMVISLWSLGVFVCSVNPKNESCKFLWSFPWFSPIVCPPPHTFLCIDICSENVSHDLLNLIYITLP